MDEAADETWLLNCGFIMAEDGYWLYSRRNGDKGK